MMTSSSPYLIRARAEYDQLRAAILDIRDTAAQAPPRTAGGRPGRDLTDVELRSCEAMAEQAEALLPQIESLTAVETRTRNVGELSNSLNGHSDDVETRGQLEGGALHLRSSAGGSQTRVLARDPGHYRAERDGGRHSFFADLVRSREGDSEAAARLNEHNRALSTGVAGAGVVPPNWLTDEYESLARQGRVVSADGVRRIQITNPAPMTLQRQTTGTDNVVAQQSTENTHPSETDAYASTVDVVVPKPISGIQVVSRQMIDMTSPAADMLIYGDMLAVYNRKIEDLVTAALAAAAGTAVTVFASDGTNFTGSAAEDAVTDAAFAVWNARKLPATAIAMRVTRWGRFNKFRDSTGRKLFPTSDAGPMNVDGVGSIQAPGSIGGLPVLATDGLGIGGATYPETILVYRASDCILFESAMQRFRYEEIAGPESVKLGIWAYAAVIVRQNANSVRKITITAA